MPIAAKILLVDDQPARLLTYEAILADLGYRLVKAGSGLATLGIAASPGVPQAIAKLTLDAPYNDLAAVAKLFDTHPGAIAAVIVEPVAANMGVVLPGTGFLQGLSELTRRHGALLIFDEVITGFRLCYGGAQTLYGI